MAETIDKIIVIVGYLLAILIPILYYTLLKKKTHSTKNMQNIL